ncbi:hypothetical protein F2Q70_00002143 [Brassica cretica]|uniref:Uncharacterized protein n=1 Tax=Brassica cretica TaxID=69181 RepID=A0A8S9J0I4_BRACR|nr:hypothetical protein F2Q70_00002143 [Brassica cretica]
MVYTRRGQNTDNDTPATKESIADLQAQITVLVTAVTNLTTQRTAPVIRHKGNNQADNNDEFEEVQNPLARLRLQPPIRNNTNESDLDKKGYGTRDNEDS